jgi:hypothetical protein
MSTNLKQESTSTRGMAFVITCAFAVGVLTAAFLMDKGDGLVPEATAATAQDGVGYFPAQFPTVDTPVEPHIDAF